MNPIREWWHRFLPQPKEPTNGSRPAMEEPPYPILCGLVPRNGSLEIVFEDQGERGFKQAIIPSDLVRRYNRATNEWRAVQILLAGLPTANRKRKSRKRPTLESIAARDSEPKE